jgi:hypothetical protein
MVEVFMTRTVLLRSWMSWKLSCPVLEAGGREQSLLPSYHVRYIEHHQLPNIKRPVYVISILENYSRAVLASKISPTQNQWDYLEVLFAAFSSAGIPKAIVSDGGKIFYCNQALTVYKALGITKERIEKRQAWQNYVRRVGVYWNPCAMQERSRAKMTSRIMTYLEGKPEEKNSMSLKWRKVKGMETLALRILCVW